MKKMIFKFLMLGVATFLLANTTMGQYENDERILIKINGDDITVAEFMNVYQKNNVNNQVVDKKSLQEYLELYINFKLKVKEAKELGMDTSQAFIKELSGYRGQLADPYFVDEKVNEELMQTAYERMQYDLRASHILIKVDQYAAPEDTMKTYGRITQLRERILQGEGFAKVADEESDDPTAKDRAGADNSPPRKGNHGDLGYFTAFDMIYPFEETAYKMPIGEISIPFRTTYGYHIIKVTDKQKALGKAKVAHLYKKFPQNPSSEDSARLEKEINDLYLKIKSGEKFEDLVKQYSDDRGSRDRGGALPWFGTNRMVPEFIVEVKALKDTGDISKPVLTMFGWHIIKLLDRKRPGTFDDEKAEIKRKLTKDSRAKKSRNAVINRIKKEYGFKEYAKAKSVLYETLDSNFIKSKWTLEQAAGLNDPLFELAGQVKTQQDFGALLEKTQGRRGIKPLKDFYEIQYNTYVEDACIAYEDSQLEKKYPEFKMLMKEYHEGILLFNLTDEKVWSKAIKDTIGLEAFHQQNMNNYMWEERLDATAYIINDKTIADEVKKMTRKNLSQEEILNTYNSDTATRVIIESDKYSKGENQLIDKIPWAKGTTKYFNAADFTHYSKNKKIAEDALIFVKVESVLEPQPKILNEARGLITSDYQNYLEKEWIKELKGKYSINVYEEVLSTLK